MKAKSPQNRQSKKTPQKSTDLFTRQLTSCLMVQAGLLPRSILGQKDLPPKMSSYGRIR